MESIARLRHICREVQPRGTWSGAFDSPDLVAEYLFRTHCVARASVPLMNAALAEADARAPKDRVSAGLRPYLVRHIEEEQDHADWLLEDLAHLGRRRQAIWRRLPPSVVAEGVGAQYYWIHHHHPVALFGYMAVLESSIPSRATFQRFVARSSLPAAAFRTLLAHTHRDPGHVRALFRCLDSLPLQLRHVRAILASARCTVEFMKRNAAELSNGGRSPAALLVENRS